MNSENYFSNLQLISIAACSSHQITDFYKKNREFHLSTSPKRSDLYYTNEYWQKALPVHLKELEIGSSQRFFIVDERQKIIGNINFSNIQNFPLHACNLGYAMDEDYTGKGIMTHFLNIAIEYVFMKTDIHKVFANHTPWNKSSEKVLRKLGFEKIGMCPDYLMINDKWENHILNVKFK